MSPNNQIVQKIFTGEDYTLIWVEAFLKAKKAEGLAKGSVKYYQINLKTFTDFLEGQEVKFISQITPNLIRDFLLLMEERGHNPGGIHGYFRTVKVFLKWYWNEVEPNEVNPINKVKAPKVPQESIQGITREEFESLLEECKLERDKAILYTLYDTGVRATELTNIKLEDLNLIDNSILIEQGKGRKPRFVFFGKATKRQLRAYLKLRQDSSPYLFTLRDGERMDYESLRAIIRRLSLKANLQVGLHDFRRAFTLNLLQANVPEITIARLLGHTSTVLIGRYANQLKEHLQLSYKSPLDSS